MRIKQDTGDIPGQMNLNELLKPEKPKKDKLLKVGDRIGRVVLGECYTATITAVEGLPDWPFYRTTRGCYTYEEGLKSIEVLEKEAEEARLKYITIEVKNSKITIDRFGCLKTRKTIIKIGIKYLTHFVELNISESR